MQDFIVGGAILALFSASALLGFVLRKRLPETHRSKDAIELIQLVMSLLVTFTAIVLGLLTTSVKADYDKADHDRIQFAGNLTQLDRCMRNYGAGSEMARAQMRAYTAAVIVSTWPSEPKPADVTYPDPSRMDRTGPNPVLADLINDVGLEINKLDPHDDLHRNIAKDCHDVFRSVLQDRWAVIEDIYNTMATPFFCAVVFWLALLFAGFGLLAPPVPLAWTVIGLCDLAVSSALFIIEDMNTPYGGLFQITSTAMRTALAHMMAP